MERTGKRAMTLDPTDPSFERRENLVYKNGSGSKVYPVDFPEVKEYMRWRVARNQKRLRKLSLAASCIQRGWRAYLARSLVKRMRRQQAALLMQRSWRARLARKVLAEKKKEIWAARLMQRNWRGKAGRDTFLRKRAERAAASMVQRVFRGKLSRNRVSNMRNRRAKSATWVQKVWRSKKAREYAYRRRNERNAAIDIQRCWRGCMGRRKATMERDKYLFSKAQSQGIEFGRQMLLEHKLHGTRLQSEVALLTREKVETEDRVEALLKEISQFEEGVRQLEREMRELSKVETEAKGVLDEEARVELRTQKARLDGEFRLMLQKISDRKEVLAGLEAKLQTLDRHRQAKDEELRDLERKLVVLLEEQQNELEMIKNRQQKRGEMFLKTDPAKGAIIAQNMGAGDLVGGGGGGGGGVLGGGRGPTPHQTQQAKALMQSTETLMKFGFMSMSLTYFSSLNMVRAMRATGAMETLMAAGAAGPVDAAERGKAGLLGAPGDFKAGLKGGQIPGQEDMEVARWSVKDVGDWLATLNLGQYREAFADAAVDGAFLYDLNDDDLRNTLGIDHNLHRKKILNQIYRLRIGEQQKLVAQQGLGAISGMPANLSNALAVQQGANAAAAAAAAGALPQPGGGFPTAILPPQAQASSAAAPMDNIGSAIATIGAADAAQQIGAVSQVADTTGNAATPNFRLDDLFSWVRNGRYKNLKEALGPLPNRRFDPSNVDIQYVEDFGTQYKEEYERQAFHLNKVDNFGNTLFVVASQNGSDKMCKFLLNKGANQNHQVG